MTTTARLRVAAAFAVAIVVAAALAAHPALAQVQAQAWRHAIIAPKSDAGFQVMALRAGYAARQGLDLKLPTFPNDVTMLRALLAGELESYEGGPGTALIAAARNADVKIVGCHWQTVVHSVFARDEFTGPPDMRGATLAISAPNATPDLIGRTWLAQNGIPFSEVKFAGLGNDAERYQALAGKLALATIISIEFLPIGRKDGIKLVARGSDVTPKYLRLCTVTSGKLIQTRRGDVVKFLAAQMQGYRYALSHRHEELSITREITGTGLSDPRPEFMFEEAANPKTGIDWTMPIVPSKLEWLQDQLIKVGNLGQPYDIARVINTEIRTEALARAGL